MGGGVPVSSVVSFKIPSFIIPEFTLPKGPNFRVFFQKSLDTMTVCFGDKNQKKRFLGNFPT